MATTRKRTAVAEMPTRARYDELKTMLKARQHELIEAVHGRIRDVRAEGADKPHRVLDTADTSEVDSQDDLELALIEMKAETLTRITEALSRLEDGTYGRCSECREEIAEARLSAVPFAVRCKACQEDRERARDSEQMLQRRATGLPSFDIRR